jgi:hypothetical protein
MKYCVDCAKEVNELHIHCPKCGSHPDRHELRDHSLMWGDGELWCVDCETKVRNWNSG